MFVLTVIISLFVFIALSGADLLVRTRAPMSSAIWVVSSGNNESGRLPS